jgi:hypothetical protein
MILRVEESEAGTALLYPFASSIVEMP